MDSNPDKGIYNKCAPVFNLCYKFLFYRVVNKQLTNDHGKLQSHKSTCYTVPVPWMTCHRMSDKINKQEFLLFCICIIKNILGEFKENLKREQEVVQTCNFICGFIQYYFLNKCLFLDYRR